MTPSICSYLTSLVQYMVLASNVDRVIYSLKTHRALTMYQIMCSSVVLMGPLSLLAGGCCRGNANIRNMDVLGSSGETGIWEGRF